jgi:ribosomal protein S6
MKYTYELSFWLKNDADENIPQLKKLFKDFNFEIIQEIPPKVKNLAYPIQKEVIAKFGTFYFYADKEKIEEFKNKLKAFSDILRFIILRRKHLKLNTNG